MWLAKHYITITVIQISSLRCFRSLIRLAVSRLSKRLSVTSRVWTFFPRWQYSKLKAKSTKYFMWQVRNEYGKNFVIVGCSSTIQTQSHTLGSYRNQESPLFILDSSCESVYLRRPEGYIHQCGTRLVVYIKASKFGHLSIREVWCWEKMLPEKHVHTIYCETHNLFGYFLSGPP